MNKSDEQIVNEIDEKINKFESNYNKAPKFIMLGSLAYFNLKIYCEAINSEEAEWDLKPGENQKYLKSYKGFKIIINSLDERIGVYKPHQDEVSVLGD